MAACSASSGSYLTEDLPRESTSSSDAKFLYVPPDVGDEIEVNEDVEKSSKGRKRTRNPDNWSKKHVKKPGVRKNSTITEGMECCRKKFFQIFNVSHLQKIRMNFESMRYEEQNIYLNGTIASP